MVRRFLLVAAAIVVLVIATCAPAFADQQPPPPPAEGPPPAVAVEPAPALAPAPAPTEVDWHRDPRARRAGRSERRWYGWQTLIADGASLLAMPTLAATAGNGGEALAYVAVGGYFLGPPLVHVAHGRPGIAAASLGLRAGLPLGGVVLGAAAQGDCRGDFCAFGGALIGAALGVLAAITLDAAALSYEKVHDEEDEDDASTQTRRRSTF